MATALLLQAMPRFCTRHDLPPEILKQILGRIPTPRDTFALSATCQQPGRTLVTGLKDSDSDSEECYSDSDEEAFEDDLDVLQGYSLVVPIMDEDMLEIYPMEAQDKAVFYSSRGQGVSYRQAYKVPFVDGPLGEVEAGDPVFTVILVLAPFDEPRSCFGSEYGKCSRSAGRSGLRSCTSIVLPKRASAVKRARLWMMPSPISSGARAKAGLAVNGGAGAGAPGAGRDGRVEARMARVSGVVRTNKLPCMSRRTSLRAYTRGSHKIGMAPPQGRFHARRGEPARRLEPEDVSAVSEDVVGLENDPTASGKIDPTSLAMEYQA
ncbi:hypothetical protein B0T11DRAFT_298874 [Plectosphaerella cucumerina]|uniref:F-box domain-containing protein n=1 Tax=Plectosphaerella cucumerina TaxID=40658 RepID=A0A8K0TJH7_9PEZI|nr:hypothetical protein B0T11DRAFT_298874 [Plectosphaerella cucumerina]